MPVHKVDAWAGFFRVRPFLYKIKRWCIYGAVLIPEGCLPGVSALHTWVLVMELLRRLLEAVCRCQFPSSGHVCLVLL